MIRLLCSYHTNVDRNYHADIFNLIFGSLGSTIIIAKDQALMEDTNYVIQLILQQNIHLDHYCMKTNQNYVENTD